MPAEGNRELDQYGQAYVLLLACASTLMYIYRWDQLNILKQFIPMMIMVKFGSVSEETICVRVNRKLSTDNGTK